MDAMRGCARAIIIQTAEGADLIDLHQRQACSGTGWPPGADITRLPKPAPRIRSETGELYARFCCLIDFAPALARDRRGGIFVRGAWGALGVCLPSASGYRIRI